MLILYKMYFLFLVHFVCSDIFRRPNFIIYRTWSYRVSVIEMNWFWAFIWEFIWEFISHYAKVHAVPQIIKSTFFNHKWKSHVYQTKTSSPSDKCLMADRWFGWWFDAGVIELGQKDNHLACAALFLSRLKRVGIWTVNIPTLSKHTQHQAPNYVHVTTVEAPLFNKIIFRKYCYY